MSSNFSRMPTGCPRGRAWLALALLLLAASAGAVEVVKSPHDPRSYRALTLDNGLEVVLVSDADTDKAAASLDVNVGSGSDPAGREGLAHFLEHMLFLGTDKYPDPAEYKEFISSHGGGENAYTAYDHTNYFFDVDHRHLEPALDRFAQFFIAPRFDPDYVSRERQVVHSEYASKLRSDGRRQFYARKQAMNPRHPYARFAVGDNVTLADREGDGIRDELIEFYRDHYSANLMTLSVLGREPLDVLEQWVRARFSAIPNTRKQRLAAGEPLFEKDRLPARLTIVPVKERQSVTLTFPIPPVDEHLRSKPTFYIAHMLGHEGKGSLLSLLKDKGWSDGLSAGLGVRHPEEATFDVSIKLTPAGVEHLDDVVAHVFEYIELMRRNGVDRWMFEEQRKLAEMRFRYAQKAEPRSLVTALAASLHELPARDVLRGNYALDEFEPELVERYLAALRPDNMLLTLIVSDVPTDSVTDKYGVEYRIDPIATETIAAWKGAQPHEALALPGPNQFVPDDLALLEGGLAEAKPSAIVREEGFELWHRLDTQFGLPLANFYFSVRSPVANDSARNAFLTTLYVRMVNDQLQEFAYDADIAGLEYQLYPHIRGFTGKVSGYDDKQKVLLERMVGALRAPELSAERFAVIKEDVVRGLRNSAENSPYRRALSEVRHLLIEPNWSDEQLLEVADGVRIDDLREFVPRLLASVQVVSLAHGNLASDQALAMGRIVEQSLVEPARAVEVPRGRVVKLEEGDRYVRDVSNTQEDSAVVVYFQGSDRDYASRARAALITQIMAPPFFEELRTEKKLGYIVFATRLSMLETPGVAFVVQSPIAGPAALSAHVEQFVSGFAGRIAEMDQSTFERHKTALLVNLMEADATLDDRSARYWNEIDEREYDFDLRERIAEAVRATSIEDLRREYAALLGPSDRRRLLVRAPGVSHRTAGGGDDGVADGTLILNAPSFKLDKGFVSG